MPARFVFSAVAAFFALAPGTTAAAPARSDREVLRDAAFARAPRAKEQPVETERFAIRRPDAVEARGGDRIDTERPRSDLKALSAGGATAAFRVKF